MQDATLGSVPAATMVDGTPLVQLERGAPTWSGTPLNLRPRKVSRALLGEEFAGLWLDVWTNPKRKVFKMFASGDGDSQDEVIAVLVIDHNLPGASNPLTIEDLNEMDSDVYLAVVSAVAETLTAALAPKVSTKS